MAATSDTADQSRLSELPVWVYVTQDTVISLPGLFSSSQSADFNYGLLYTSGRGGVTYAPHATTAILDGKAIELNRGTALVNDVAYLLANRDVRIAGTDAEQHYFQYGWKEGRETGSPFDAAFYLSRNPDVAAAGVNPVLHYLEFGWKEGRDPSITFDTDFYLAHNPDVAASGMNPFEHYLRFGRFETRDPNSLFDADFYLRHEPAAGELGAEPLAHYLETGWRNEQAASARFITTVYLYQNPDVARSGMNPFEHYLLYGRDEGRKIGSGIPATITGLDTGTVRDSGRDSASGHLYVSDVDVDESPFETDYGTYRDASGKYGSVRIESNGFWTYTLGSSHETLALHRGETLVDNVTVRTLGFDEHTITITIEGENQAASIGGTTEADLSEMAGRFAYGRLTIRDPDHDEQGFASGPFVGTYGSVTLSQDYIWTYEFMGNAALHVTPGTTHAALEDAVTVRSLDGTEAVLLIHIAP